MWAVSSWPGWNPRERTKCSSPSDNLSIAAQDSGRFSTCYLFLSNPGDCARVEPSVLFIKKCETFSHSVWCMYIVYITGSCFLLTRPFEVHVFCTWTVPRTLPLLFCPCRIAVVFYWGAKLAPLAANLEIIPQCLPCSFCFTALAARDVFPVPEWKSEDACNA